jgi:HAD superfamily hydrolase (TIGR01549 family)
MTNQVSAVLFDMGGTLRRNIPRDEASRAAIIQQMLVLLGLEMPATELSWLLAARADAYEEWASKNLVELDESGVWTRWMLPEHPPEMISRLALELNRIWREAICTRSFFPETVGVITRLHQAGYRLGLVSNTTSSLDAPAALENAGIARYFEVIVLSCVLGKRKPGPEILLEAAGRLGVLPGECAYIGDRLDWDVLAARRAGFGMALLRRTPGKLFPSPLPPELTPDYIIDTLEDLLPIFPPLQS